MVTVVDGVLGGAKVEPARDDVADAAMERYADGDVAAFRVLYDAIAPRLYAFLLRQVRDPAHAEDLVQQALLQIHDARGAYIAGARVVPWAFAIARNLVIDGHRKRRRRDRFEAHHPVDDPPSDEPRPDEVIQAREAAQHLERVLSGLPESHRLAFELLKYDGLSLIEAAEVLGISVGALKVRAHRVYKAMRAAVE